MSKSAVIIGGGLGGLFTGAILAKEGVKVTVIEKNTTVGGGLQSFTRFGEVFDTGMHILGGMNPSGNAYKVCQYLGILDKVCHQEVDAQVVDSIYFASDKTYYHTAKGKENFVAALAAQFPHQKDHLTAYVEALYRIVGEFDLFYLRSTKEGAFLPTYSNEAMSPVNHFIAQYISDEKLRNVLAYLNPFYGGVENVTPTYIHALISVLYINGPTRLAGGSYLFAEALKEVILQNGGEVRVSDGVAKVMSADKTITSVITQKGKVYTADYYICAIHPCTFLTLLDDVTLLPKAFRNRLHTIPNTGSAFLLNIKFKKDTFPYINHSSYYMNNYEDIWRFGDETFHWPLGFLYITPPEKEQGAFANKLIVTAPMSWSEVKQWEHTTLSNRPADYQQWKEACAEKLIQKLTEIYPNFRDSIEAINTASPLTIRDYYGTKEGSMYGFCKDANNIVLSQIPIFTKVPNLFLTGQNCGGHGFCGVMLTAIQTSEALLGQNYVLNKINSHE